MEDMDFKLLITKIDEIQKNVVDLKGDMSKFKASVDAKFKSIDKNMKKNSKNFKNFKSDISKFKASLDTKFKNIDEEMKKNSKNLKKKMKKNQNLFDTQIKNLKHYKTFTSKVDNDVPWEDTLDGMSMAAVGGISKNLGSTSDTY